MSFMTSQRAHCQNFWLSAAGQSAEGWTLLNPGEFADRTRHIMGEITADVNVSDETFKNSGIKGRIVPQQSDRENTTGPQRDNAVTSSKLYLAAISRSATVISQPDLHRSVCVRARALCSDLITLPIFSSCHRATLIFSTLKQLCIEICVC